MNKTTQSTVEELVNHKDNLSKCHSNSDGESGLGAHLEKEPTVDVKPEDVSTQLNGYLKQLDDLKVNNKSGSSPNDIAQITAIVTGMILLMQSNNAQAASLSDLIERFAQEISSTLTDQLTPMFEGIMAIFSGEWGSLMESEGDKTTVTIAKVGDSINQVAKTLEQERIKRETAPRPNACELDDAARLESSAKANTAEISSQVKDRNTQSYSEEVSSGDRPGLAKAAAKINSPDTDLKKVLNPSVLDKGKLTDAEVEQAEVFVDMLKATASEGVTIRRHNPDMSQPSLIKQAKNASKITHIELATSVFVDDINRRKIVSSGESEHSLLEKQITDTYYSEAWRQGINELAAPTPLLIDLAMQTATTNKLLFDMAQNQTMQNKLLASLILKANERG
ncbi:hypothetical protein GCM10011607_28310 [Shewanella inventionis]|uniref:Uncharacterized protein n=1 Tax=Shewanella inventionis TaxID=1738770 RepID=A0ABQ1JD70_9GAMM|nr:hypothetical protein [Shewanella inventionis]GGB65934.1 hypothetical protein GCM10011607_28310 [Shewanella inventionis]